MAGPAPEASGPGRRPGRLLKRAEFLAVRAGEKRRGRLFLLEAMDRGDGGNPRFGLTVTKKTGNAVVRNRIRRRIREALRVHAADAAAPGTDYVVVARRECLDVRFDDLKAELARRVRGAAKGGTAGNGK